MRVLLFCAAFLMHPTVAISQNIVAPPVDQASQDATFLRFRTNLLNAVIARDTEAVVAMSSTDISLSFGGSEGHDEFRDFLNVPVEKLNDDYKPRAPEMRAENWTALETVLKMGGKFVEGGFSAPYTWLGPEPNHMDPYDIYYVIGSNVLMRTAGNINASVLRHLHYNVVEVYPFDHDAPYQAIRLPDGTDGFVATQYLRFLLDYRANFYKRDGKWQMTSFLAGD